MKDHWAAILSVLVNLVSIIAMAVGTIHIMDLRLAKLEERYDASMAKNAAKFVQLDHHIDELNKLGNRVTSMETSYGYTNRALDGIHADLQSIHSELKVLSRQRPEK